MTEPQDTVDCRYPVYKLFSSLQGEATWAGRAMFFLRFSGCPLACSWCDEPLHRDPQGVYYWTETEILAKLRQLDPDLSSVLLTGGEPLIVKDLARLVRFLKGQGYWVAMETCGVGGAVPAEVDWVTLSPKTPLSEELFDRANEVKYIIGADPAIQQTMEIRRRAKIHTNVWVQPQSWGPTGGRRDSPVPSQEGGWLFAPAALEQCLEHIRYSKGQIRLSLQTHKLVGLP